MRESRRSSLPCPGRKPKWPTTPSPLWFQILVSFESMTPVLSLQTSRGSSSKRRAGLGHRFLKHVERCRLLLHLISTDEDSETIDDPIERYRLLQKEVGAFSPELEQLPQIVVLSKCDLIDSDRTKELVARLQKETDSPILCISSATRQGLDALLKTCAHKLQDLLSSEGEECPKSEKWNSTRSIHACLCSPYRMWWKGERFFLQRQPSPSIRKRHLRKRHALGPSPL